MTSNKMQKNSSLQRRVPNKRKDWPFSRIKQFDKKREIEVYGEESEDWVIHIENSWNDSYPTKKSLINKLKSLLTPFVLGVVSSVAAGYLYTVIKGVF